MPPEDWESLSQAEYEEAYCDPHNAVGNISWNGAAASAEKPVRVLDTWQEYLALTLTLWSLLSSCR